MERATPEGVDDESRTPGTEPGSAGAGLTRGATERGQAGAVESAEEGGPRRHGGGPALAGTGRGGGTDDLEGRETSAHDDQRPFGEPDLDEGAGPRPEPRI